MADAETSMQDHWDDASPPGERRRPGSLRPAWTPPDIDRLKAWAEAVGQEPTPILLVEGPTPAHRAAIYRLTRTVQDDLSDSWLDEGLVKNLSHRLSKVRAIGSITPHKWDLLWNLLTLETLEVEEPLRTLIDQGHLITEAFKAIWEARFRLDEGREVKDVVSAISNWMTGDTLTTDQRALLGTLGITREPTTAFERLDMLFFLVALAKQNDLLTSTVFVFDGLEKAVMKGASRRKELLKETFDFCVAAERWARLGAPIGFLFGYAGDHKPLDAIERSNAKLGAKLKKYGLV